MDTRTIDRKDRPQAVMTARKWWTWALPGVVSGTVVHAFLGILYLAVLTALAQAFAPQADEATRMYVTWHNFWDRSVEAFEAKEILGGAVGGLAAVAVCLARPGGGLLRFAFAGAVFAVVMRLKYWGAVWEPLHELLFLFGETVKGAVVAWTAVRLHARWSDL
jgi:hypothetical protein